MRSDNRLLLTTGSIALAAIGFVAFMYVSTEAEHGTVASDAQRTIELLADDPRVRSDVATQESSIDAYLLSEDATTIGAYQAAMADEQGTVARMTAGATGNPTLQRSLSSLAAATTAWRTSFAEPAIAAVQSRDEARIAPFRTSSTYDTAAIGAALDAVSGDLRLAVSDLVAREADISASQARVMAIGAALLAAVAFFLLFAVRRYGRKISLEAGRANLLNRFTEVTSFAPDDTSVAASNLEALSLLAHPDAAVTHILNHSQDRAAPEATLGSPVADVLTLQALGTCAGLVRGSMYVATDLAAPLSVHCPIYPAERGTLACVPLRSGDTIGTVHLYWAKPDAFPLELRRDVSQIAEHAALAIGNRRLLDALHGQASTDGRTGLWNSRTFDKALEDALVARSADEPLAVLMLDLDHFKDFNDRHGHPAGDEALRTFGAILRSCMRDGDIAARYGGEEFVVLVPRTDADAALEVAERIRARTESAIIALGPGITDRMTVSIGVAVAPSQGLDRIGLLQVADEALYRAKDLGRNRVVHAGDGFVSSAA